MHTSPDDGSATVESDRLSPQSCARRLWAMAHHHAEEYAAVHDLTQLRAEMKLTGVDGDRLNVSENTRAVINCLSTDADSVAWLSEDSGPESEGYQARLNASQARELRLMSKLHALADRRESQVSTVISATEQLGSAAARLAESRLEAADALAADVMRSNSGSQLDEYGEQVMALVLPKLDSLLDAFINRHGAPSAPPQPAPAYDPTDQPPGEFFSWVLALGGPDALAAFTRDLSSAPTAGPQVRTFWAVVLEALSESLACEDSPLDDPPSAVRAWGMGLASRYTLNVPAWAAP